MDNEVKEILMQLVDTTNKLAEGQRQLFEGQKQMSADISNLKKDVAEIKEDIADIKEEAQITRSAVNHNGEVLENLIDQLTALNYTDVKY